MITPHHAHTLLIFTIFALVTLPMIIRAQLVSDGGSANISTVNFLSGNLTVGTNSGNTVLTIVAGGTVSNAVGQIGLNAGSSSNLVTVQSTSGNWLNSGTLSVGVSGDGNAVRLRTGGFISANNSRLGDNAASDFNSAVLSGGNSIWTNSGNMVVGFNGSGNFLLMTNGATLYNDTGILGSQSGSVSNVALIAEANTLWTNRSDLRVGGGGAFNRLVVSNEAVVGVGGDFTIGRNDGATNNTARLENGTMIVAGTTDVRRGTLELQAGQLTTGTLLLTNAGAAFNFYGGSLTLQDGVVSNGLGFFVGIPASSAAPAKLTVAGGRLDVFNEAILGYGNSNTICVFTNGGSLFTANSPVSIGYTASGNSVWVTGSGSSISNVAQINLGSGTSSSGNLLVLTNGGRAHDNYGYVGVGSTSSSNTAIVTGSGSVWTNQDDLYIGSSLSGPGNRLLVTSGGRVDAATISLGFVSSSSNNLVLVDGSGSIIKSPDGVSVGIFSPGNQVVVTNGGLASSTNANGSFYIGYGNYPGNSATVTGAGSKWDTVYLDVGRNGYHSRLLIAAGGTVNAVNSTIGLGSTANSNTVVVTGSGSYWTNGILYIGSSGSGNQLLVTNSGAVGVDGGIYLGSTSASSNNLLRVDGGTVYSDDSICIYRGALQVNSGSVTARRLIITNSGGFCQLNGGTLSIFTTTTNANGSAFIVGNGSNVATYAMSSANTLSLGVAHYFNQGLLVTNRGTLTGNGIIFGTATISPGGTISPGSGIGRIIFTNNAPVLRGIALMEISQNGSIATNDVLLVNAAITYAGSLLVSNLGPSTLTIGKNFRLFNATSYAGAFTNISLPTPPTGLLWTNKLLVDGSIELISGGVAVFNTVTTSGTNMIFTVTLGTPGGTYKILTATNLTIPVINWTTNSSGTFDGGGNATITNGMSKTTPTRFFRVRTP